MIPIPLIMAGLELLKTAKSDNTIENENKVIEVLSKVTDIRPFWKTKTFWSTCVGVLVPVLNRVLGWDMDVTEVSAAISPLIVFIFTEQWKKKG